MRVSRSLTILACAAGPLIWSQPAHADTEGRRLYTVNCMSCHGPTATGGASGDIRGLGEATMRRALRGVEQMPAFDLTDAEIAALISYIDTLGTSQP